MKYESRFESPEESERLDRNRNGLATTIGVIALALALVLGLAAKSQAQEKILYAYDSTGTYMQSDVDMLPGNDPGTIVLPATSGEGLQMCRIHREDSEDFILFFPKKWLITLRRHPQDPSVILAHVTDPNKPERGLEPRKTDSRALCLNCTAMRVAGEGDAHYPSNLVFSTNTDDAEFEHCSSGTPDTFQILDRPL